MFSSKLNPKNYMDLNKRDSHFEVEKNVPGNMSEMPECVS